MRVRGGKHSLATRAVINHGHFWQLLCCQLLRELVEEIEKKKNTHTHTHFFPEILRLTGQHRYTLCATLLIKTNILFCARLEFSGKAGRSLAFCLSTPFTIFTRLVLLSPLVAT